MRDFTNKIYSRLLEALINYGYSFLSFEEFISKIRGETQKIVLIRHDVDKLPNNSLEIAKIESLSGIKSTYYFRTVKKSYNEVIIKQIIDLGHEIGYHYENMDVCNGNIDLAWNDFRKNLQKLRKLYPIKTICMHGSPLSKYDNRFLWNKYDYREVDIIGEPYIDIDFTKMAYLTDTGRKWDGDTVSMRDKVNSKHSYPIKTTHDLIEHLNDGKLPAHIMITTHPQRWTNNMFSWGSEFILQNAKNIIKKRMNRK